MPDARLRVTASLDESGEGSTPLLVAIGRTVQAVAGLEKMLLLEIARLLMERDSIDGTTPNRQFDEELSRLDGSLLDWDFRKRSRVNPILVLRELHTLNQ